MITGCEGIEREGTYFAGSEGVDMLFGFVVLCFVLFGGDVIFGCWVIFLKSSFLHLNDIIRNKNRLVFTIKYCEKVRQSSRC